MNKTLRKIAEDLRKAVAEEDIDRDEIQLAARRLDMQAEMIDEGIAG